MTTIDEAIFDIQRRAAALGWVVDYMYLDGINIWCVNEEVTGAPISDNYASFADVEQFIAEEEAKHAR